jgi:hypothetical protein
LDLTGGGELDWQYILAFAREQGVVPLVHHSLKRLPGGMLPEDMKIHLAREAWAQAERNLVNAVELAKLLKLFAGHGIEAIPFKGPVLSLALYRDLRFRTSGDLDILVRRRDFPKAGDLLLSCGFEAKEIANAEEFLELLEESKDYSFWRDDGVFIELHWELLSPTMPFLPPAETLWQEAVAVPFLDMRATQLPPELMFVLLCVHHGVSHFYDRLILACDIDRFIKTYPALDWGRVLNLAEQSDCTRAILLGCLMARLFLDTPLPGELSGRLQKDGAVQRLATEAIGWRAKNSLRKITFSQRLLLHLRIKSSWRGKLRLIQSLFFTPKRGDRKLVDLPSGLRGLYLLLRPLRILFKVLLSRNRQP